MLSIAKLGDAGYYIDLAREDYYLEGGEPPGQWLGRGSKILDLEGEVQKEALTNLLLGFFPDGSTKLVQNAGADNRQAGWDFTFSAPKSVSTFWSQAEPETRQVVQAAQAKAVEAAVNYLEEVAGFSRRGKGGAGDLDRAVFVAAAFEHGTSRAQDPQLHTHVVVVNGTIRPDGTPGSIESQPFFDQKMTAGALYRAELSAQLEQSLGLRLVQERAFFKAEAVPDSLTDAFSKRRADIEASLAESGFTGAKAAKVAALMTRDEKEHRPRAELFAEWQTEGLAHGFSLPEVQAALHQAPPRDLEEERAALLVAALEGLATHENFFSETDLTRALAEAAQAHGLGINEVLAAKEVATHDARFVYLGREEGERLFTTEATIHAEKWAIKLTNYDRLNERFVLSEATYEQALRSHPTLSQEQTGALAYLLTVPGTVHVLPGLAGVGKSFLFDAARSGWEAEGFTVLGAAPSARAARALQEGSGIESRTIQKLVKSIDEGFQQLNERTVIVLDEAGMTDTRMLYQLLNHANIGRSKVVLTGDPKQLQSVEAGGVFAYLCNDARDPLTDIQRQREAWQREAIREFAQGDPTKALRAFEERGFLFVTPTREEAMEKLIHKWKETGVEAPASSLLLAATRADARALNTEAQAQRHAQLGAEGIPVDGYYVYQGDRVRFTRNNFLRGIENGSFGIVEVIDKDSITVRLDDGRQIRAPLAEQNVTLGYASTTHAAQGATVERAFVLLGSTLQDRKLTYVQASRAREDTYFAIDRESAGPYLRKLMHSVAEVPDQRLAIQLDNTPATPQLEIRHEWEHSR